MMEEDNSTNRLHDALELWESIVNNRYLKGSISRNMYKETPFPLIKSCLLIDLPFVLFLNKKDLFEEKIKDVDLRVCFPDYKGMVFLFVKIHDTHAIGRGKVLHDIN